MKINAVKIAIFSDNFYPELSGISDSVITLSKELVSRGHSVRFYVPYYSPKDYGIAQLEPRELDLGNNITITRFSSIPFTSAGSTGQTRFVIPTGLRCLSFIRNRPDIIHTQQMYGAGIEAVAAAKYLKIPIVGTNHTALREFLSFSPIKAKWFKKWSLGYESWYYNQCEFVSAPSQSVFDDMEQNGFYRPHSVVSNPIDTEIFRAGSDSERAEVKAANGFSEKTVFYAGRLGPEKNVDVIIKAMALVNKEIPEVCLAIAGHGTSRGALKAMADEMSIGKSVKFLGTLDKPSLAKIYNASEVFAITSTSETQSLTLMQAMACGLPVVGVRAKALPEYINVENGFIVEPGDYEGLAEKIVFLLKNSKQRELLGRGALEHSRKYSASRITDEWERIYRETLGNKRHI